MSQFRKKPVVIDAAEVDVLLWCAARDWGGLPAWMIVAYEAGDVLFLRDAIEIKTLEGTLRLSCGARGRSLLGHLADLHRRVGNGRHQGSG